MGQAGDFSENYFELKKIILGLQSEVPFDLRNYIFKCNNALHTYVRKSLESEGLNDSFIFNASIFKVSDDNIVTFDFDMDSDCFNINQFPTEFELYTKIATQIKNGQLPSISTFIIKNKLPKSLLLYVHNSEELLPDYNFDTLSIYLLEKQNESWENSDLFPISNINELKKNSLFSSYTNLLNQYYHYAFSTNGEKHGFYLYLLKPFSGSKNQSFNAVFSLALTTYLEPKEYEMLSLLLNFIYNPISNSELAKRDRLIELGQANFLSHHVLADYMRGLKGELNDTITRISIDYFDEFNSFSKRLDIAASVFMTYSQIGKIIAHISRNPQLEGNVLQYEPFMEKITEKDKIVGVFDKIKEIYLTYMDVETLVINDCIRQVYLTPFLLENEIERYNLNEEFYLGIFHSIIYNIYNYRLKRTPVSVSFNEDSKEVIFRNHPKKGKFINFELKGDFLQIQTLFKLTGWGDIECGFEEGIFFTKLKMINISSDEN